MPRVHIPVFVGVIAIAAACGGSKKPAATPAPAASGGSSTAAPLGASTTGGTTASPSGQPTVASEQPVVSVPAERPISADPLAGQPPDAINKLEPLKPVFFAYDSDQLDDLARQALADDAQMLKKYGTWVVTIEGHSVERGTAEYNLALGERRALTVRNYLLSLGLTPARFKVVSYGKEFPFDPAHSESAWSTNRRAHLVVTASK